MPVNKNLKNILSLFSVEFIARFLGFIAVTYLARVLGTANFGVINIGLAVLNYAVVAGFGGLTLLGTRSIASQQDKPEVITGNLILSRLLLSIILFFLVSIISFYFVQNQQVFEIIIVFMFFLFPSAFLLEWFFHGKQRLDIVSIGRVTGMLSYLIFLLILVKESDDTLLTGAAWVTGGAINTIYLLILFKKNKYKIIFNLKQFDFFKYLKDSFSLSAAVILTQFVAQFPVIYLSIAVTITDVGIYSAAYKLIILLLVFDRVFNAVFFPKIVQYMKNFPEKSGEIFHKILRIISAFSLSVSLLAVAAGDFLINFIFGNEFSSASLIFRILIGCFFFTIINSVFIYTLIAGKKEKIYSFAVLTGMIIFIFSILIFTHYWGAAGSAAAFVLFEVTVFIYMLLKFPKEFELKVLRNLIIPFTVTYFILIPALFIFNFPLIVEIIIAFFVGIPLIIFAGGIKKDDLIFIKKVFT